MSLIKKISRGWSWFVSHKPFLLFLLLIIIVSILVSSIEGQKHLSVWLFSFSFDRNTAATVFGVLLAVIGLIYAVYQIELSKEVEVLEEMPEIVTEIVKRIRKAKSIFFMATTPAIGASGAPDEAQELEKVLIDFSELKRRKPEKMQFLCYKKEDIKKFYEEHQINYNDTEVERITNDILGKIDALKKSIIAEVFDVGYSRIPFLHFLLIDPESKSREKRRGVLWYLEASNGRVIKGTGFSTNNEAVIETLRRVFNKQRETLVQNSS